jgi:hypothetical protein
MKKIDVHSSVRPRLPDRVAKVRPPPQARRSLPEEPREPFFDRWLTAATIDFEVIVAEVIATLDADVPRQRKRKVADLETHTALVTTVIANLAYALVAKREPPRIAVPLGKPKAKLSRYERPGFRLLAATLDDLDATDFLMLTKSERRGRVSTIEPTPRLARLVSDAGTTFADFTRARGEETITLSRSQWDYPAGIKRREWLDYSDTAETRRYRQEMVEVNDYLEEASLSWRDTSAPARDLGERRLHRAFNLPAWVRPQRPVFRFGGRLFGGFWENAPSVSRSSLRIEGESHADLDFKNLFARLAYVYAGFPPPSPRDDLYAVPGFENHRRGIKLVTSAMLFSRTRLRRLPRDAKPYLPPGTTAATVRSAILIRHPALASIFEKGVGFSLMFTESQILVAVLLSLYRRGITGLPMHDGIMVPRSKSAAAQRTMIAVAKRLTGHPLPIEAE